MALRAQAVVSLLSLLWCSVAAAWGPQGHRVVGYVTDLYLCKEAREGLRTDLEGEDLGSAGLWADRIRGDPRWDHASPWHYITVPDELDVAVAGRAEAGDVLWAVEHFLTALDAPGESADQRGENLRFLIHFVADIHQPLHVGRASDRGGNDLLVELDGRRMNLHRAWDTGIFELDQSTARERAVAILPLSTRRVSRWQASVPLDWARESKSLRPQVYAFNDSGPGTPLPPDYLARAQALGELRLVQAGVRLAGILNSMYCPVQGP